MSEEKAAYAVEQEDNRLMVRNVDQLSVLERDKALEIAETRTRILETVRTASLRLTNPGDWVLFKTRDGYVTAYLEDSGCERVRPLWGIEILNIRGPVEEPFGEGEFAYVFMGDGICKFTGGKTEAVEGCRTSLDDFVKDEKGILKRYRVRKAARANLDGSIVRELAGLGSVPIQELSEAWAGTGKDTKDCAKGRGFGAHPWRQPVSGKSQTRQDSFVEQNERTEEKNDVAAMRDYLMKLLLKIPKQDRQEFVEMIQETGNLDQLRDVEILIKEKVTK